ncbi:hypothetical protein [Melittangium boletus]|uniref:hypothetical protein n=1 Tax=Melittangium boletus TaxID=83453 RepID=UPI003DA69879
MPLAVTLASIAGQWGTLGSDVRHLEGRVTTAEAELARVSSAQSKADTQAQVLDAHPARLAVMKPTTRASPTVQAEAEAPVPVDEVGGGEVVKLLVQSLTSRNWDLLACALMLGAVCVVRRFLASRVPWLSSDVAGVALSMATAVSMSLVGALKTGTPLTFSLVLGTLLTAAGASGLFSWGKKLSLRGEGDRPARGGRIHPLSRATC